MFNITKEKLYMAVPIILSIAMVDQFTKSMIENSMFLNQSIEVIGGFFNIVFVKNPGAAFGMFSDWGAMRVVFLVSVSLLAVVVIAYLIGESEGMAPVIALSMIGGGAVGNLIDRAMYGEVTDFLDFYIGSYHWPAFNVADSAITIGVCLMLVIYYIEGKSEGASGSAGIEAGSEERKV